MVLRSTGGGSALFVTFDIYKFTVKGLTPVLNPHNTGEEFSGKYWGCEDPLRWKGELLFKQYKPKCSEFGDFWFENADVVHFSL